MPIHDIANSLGSNKCNGLRFFHAFSGCETVSGFRGKGKKSFFQTWNVITDVTETFVKLSKYPVYVDEQDIIKIEQFLVLLYDRSSVLTDIDAARKVFFMQKNTQFDHLPPSKAALKQHIMRAAYQGGIVWGQALDPVVYLPSPDSWGWSKQCDSVWDVHWTDLNPISDTCKELCKCGCKKECKGKCSCRKSNLQCTSICKCPCSFANQM